MTTFQPCFIIPVYNHEDFIAATLEKVTPFGLTVFLVDDGSAEVCRRLLDRLLADYPAARLIRLAHNQGKGAAVMAGFREAFLQGYTHALQLDADGQHDVQDVPLFLERARRHPEAVISGNPRYDASAPKARVYGRYVTHFWVWIETLSFEIKDSMCGFRLYPLAETMRLLERARIGLRMDFDVDILVRLYWQETPIYFIDTRVIYPPDGVSHFRMFADNWRISKMHTRLFFGMVKRLPRLIRRNIKAKGRRTSQ